MMTLHSIFAIININFLDSSSHKFHSIKLIKKVLLYEKQKPLSFTNKYCHRIPENQCLCNPHPQRNIHLLLSAKSLYILTSAHLSAFHWYWKHIEALNLHHNYHCYLFFHIQNQKHQHFQLYSSLLQVNPSVHKFQDVHRS